MLNQYAGTAPQFAEINLEPGKQEQRDDAQCREQTDGRIALEKAETQTCPST